MKTLERDRSTDRTESAAPARAPADEERLPKRIFRKAAAGAGASRGAAEAAPAAWSFGDAINAGVHRSLVARTAERDANGVAAGADAAIATASATSGAALPGVIQRKFEAALGTDLSDVRVHTGSASHAAAHAVGAKAYTIGQAIHFGSGHYDPTSAGGEHLLAHEVAHTVQQRGGTPARQNKLEVSAPQDAAEHEADCAADAMVAGRAARVGADTGIARKVMRDATTDLERAGERAAQQEQAQPMRTAVGEVSSVRDGSQATRVMAQIDGAAADLEDGRAKGDVSSAQIVANEHCKNVLSSFLVTLGEQSRTLTDFQIQANACQTDFVRLQAMIAQFSATRGELGGATDRAGGLSMAAGIVAQSGGGSAQSMATRVRRLAGSSPAFQGAFNRMQDLHTQMERLSSDIGTKQNVATAATTGFVSAISNLEAGATTRGDADPATSAALAAVRAQCQSVKRYVGMAIEQIKSRATSAAAAAGIPAPAASAAIGALPSLGEMVVDAFFEPRIADLEHRLSVARQHQSDFEYSDRLNAVRQAKSTWFAAIGDFHGAVEQFNTVRTQMQTATEEMSSSASQAGHSDISIVATFLGEADRFVAQIDACSGLGEAEQTAAGNAGDDRRRATHPEGDSGAQGLPYYTATPIFHPMHTGWSHSAIENHVGIYMYGDSFGSSDGDRGVNPIVAHTLRDVAQMKEVALGFRNELGAAMGMHDLGSGRQAGPTGPLAPSTVTPGGH